MKLLRRGSLIAFFAAVFFVFPATTFASGEFFQDTTLTYNIKNQDETRVNYGITITNRTSAAAASGMTLYTANTDIKDVSATYSNGGKIDVSVSQEEIESGDIKQVRSKITLVFNNKVFGINKSWSFNVSYSTADFVIKRGEFASIAYLPTVRVQEDDRNYSIVVQSPKSLGEPHFSAIGPSSLHSDQTMNVVTYGKDKITQSGIFVSYGEAAYYNFKMIYPLKNPIPFWKTVWITLPPTLPTQEVFITNFNRRPSEMKIDDDGNVLAGFVVGPLGFLEVEANVTVKVKFLEYDLSISGKKEELPQEIVDAYTKQDKFWEKNDSGVIALANTVYDDKKTVAENTQALYQLTISTLTYNNKKLLFNQRLGASKAVSDPGNAVCLEFADLLIAMLRSKGIPARNPIGYAYQEGLKPSDSVADSLHSWVEVFIPNVGWIQVDPTWGEKADNFGRSDFDHVAFGVYGTDSDAPTAAFIGHYDLGYQYEDSEWKFGEKVEPRIAVDLRVNTFPLPFSVLSILTAENSGNSVIYGEEITMEGEKFFPKNKIVFGNSAPFQTDKYYFFSSAKKFGKVEAKATLVAGSLGITPSTIATKSFFLPYNLSYIVAGLVILIILGLIFLAVKKHFQKPEDEF